MIAPAGCLIAPLLRFPQPAGKGVRPLATNVAQDRRVEARGVTLTREGSDSFAGRAAFPWPQTSG